MIRKAINWATNKELWEELWRRPPKQFWYFYPTGSQATIEFETKWPEFLPGPRMKEDKRYGWRALYKNKEIYGIYFNSGVTIYFKSYAQKASALQTATVDAMFADEEMPEELYDELMFRLSASRGYFNTAFTATLGQELWRKALEPTPHEKETLPGALKLQVSMYDCLKYDDGTKSHWTVEDIERIKSQCKNENEVQRRVYGKFVMDTGRMYGNFESKRHLRSAHKLPRSWSVYVGIDSGSGGKKNHPAAITFVAVNPEHTAGRVFLGWRGDGQETTSGDTVKKLRELKVEHNIHPVAQFYDWNDKDFSIICNRIGEPVTPADKAREKGEGILNTLFKNDMLILYDDPEVQKLASEFLTLRVDTPKTKATDDFIDSCRYAVSSIPWNWELGIKPQEYPQEPEKILSKEQISLQERRNKVTKYENDEKDRIEDEFEEWNELYGA